MIIGTDLQPFAANQTPDWSKVIGKLTGGGFVPASWANIKYTVGGDGIQPVAGQSFLSWQDGGGWQARAAVGPWETVYLSGNLMTFNANGSIIATPFVQVGA